jgi:hypothetical protein
MVAMSALVTLLVLGLLLVVVMLLLVWALATPGTFARAPRAERPARGTARAKRVEAEAPAPGVRVERPSNDELRGAKAAKPLVRPSLPDDAFERFLRAGRDDDH